MSELPRLASSDVRARLEEHYRTPHTHHLFAFYGTGDEGRVEVPGTGTFAIVPVESELDLRDKLDAFADPDARAAFLVPWSTEVPLDLAGRFAANGKVLRVDPRMRLMRMFNVPEVDVEASRSPIARYLLATEPSASFRIAEGRLTKDLFVQTWLSARFGLDARGGLGLDALLGWAASDARGAAFVTAMEDPRAKGVRAALLEHLEATLGPAGPAVWGAWERGQGAVALSMAVLCEKLPGPPDRSLDVWLRQKLKHALALAEGVDVARVASELGAAVEGALTTYALRTGPHERARLVAAADARIDEDALREAYAAHRRLPSAWRARLEALGRALFTGAAEPTIDALTSASEALAQLESHERFAEEQATHSVKRALMAVRLLAWLVARTDRRTEGQVAPHGDAVALGAWYATEGGYVDWARRFARGDDPDGAGTAFARGVQAVVRAADDVRAELDERFARGLAAWLEADRPSREVVPIDQALARIAVPFLKGDPERRLLVVLMDGMAWAQAVELLASLGERPMAWGPLAWHASAEGRIGSAPVPPVFAGLPTITEVSRAAFFAGAPTASGPSPSTQRDPERFENHRGLRALVDHPQAVPRLLLRAEGHTAGGAITNEALSLVNDARRRVVGIVVNAIDAWLKGDPQQHARWDVDGIRPLADLLDAAQQAGRAILLASDHGHVPTDLLERIPDVDAASARWRAWDGTGDTLREGELRVAGEGVWTPRGKDAVVVLTNDRARYGRAPNAGEHGGASLAEVVAPCVLIGSATSALDHDAAQRVVGAHVPDWWLLRVRPVEEDAHIAPKKGRKKPPDNQLSLLGDEAPPPPPSRRPPPSDLGSHPLSGSKLLQALAKRAAERDAVLRAVDFLATQRGAASAEAFAAALGELVWRVPGLVARLQGVLNVDGYQVLSFDPTTKQVRLDVAKLEQQFEVKL